ncbi:MAG: NAD-dependent epimerase/dehydratase family protein [Clostridia bacterium]|nr:NAD-dependent epimerase/dehydratase family protein [Clostridia bacterium]
MNILITGAGGFVGKNLVAALENIKNGCDRTRGELAVDELLLYDIDSDPAALADHCAKADFVFHLAGVNRPADPAEFMTGNRDLTAALLQALEQAGNTCPVMLSSSIQATLEGRFAGSEYGRSKRAGESLLFDHANRTGARVLVYRFPNLFGKWCRPNYNSAVATFCHNIARGLPITVSDPATELELVYIDDLIEEMIAALRGQEHRTPNGRYCVVPVSHRVTLGEITELLYAFSAQPCTLQMPAIPQGSFAKALYSTYLSYLPPERAAYALTANEDARGSFTEVLRTANCGQFSVNVSKPGITKGQHWHHSKWEIFVVVSGEGLIRQRPIHGGEVTEYRVSGKRPTAVQMLPGYTHSIVNLSDTEDLVTLMWANESFDKNRPDTFFEEV